MALPFWRQRLQRAQPLQEHGALPQHPPDPFSSDVGTSGGRSGSAAWPSARCVGPSWMPSGSLDGVVALSGRRCMHTAAKSAASAQSPVAP